MESSKAIFCYIRDFNKKYFGVGQVDKKLTLFFVKNKILENRMASYKRLNVVCKRLKLFNFIFTAIF